MNPSRRAAALTLALLIAAPPSWSCGSFGVVVQEAIQTGVIEGSLRTEMLAAKYDAGLNAPFVVKLFVGPPGAAVNFKEVSKEEKEKFDAVASKANAILNPPLRTRGMATRGLEPRVVAEVQIGSIKARVLDVSGFNWAQLRKQFQIATDEDVHFQEWVKRVGPENGRGLYAAYIDVSQVQDKAELKKMLSLAVTIPYSATGAKLRQEVALDKWLEYKGARRVASGFGTDWTKAQAIAASTAVMADWDLADRGATLSAEADGADTNMVMTDSQRKLIGFTLTGEQNTIFVYKNGSYVLGPHSVARPPVAAASAGAPRAQKMPAVRLPGSNPFGN